MAKYRYVTCEGRHEVNLPHSGYIFPQTVADPLNFGALYTQVEKALPKDCTYLELVVTGLTPCVLAVVSYCVDHNILLDCAHYDRESGQYFVQCVTEG